MKNSLLILSAFFFTLSCAARNSVYNPPRKMVVGVSVTNIRSVPEPHSGEYVYDSKQETQLEKGEPVLVYEKSGDWVRVAAPEQLEFTHNQKWEGYPGWVMAKDLTDDLSQHHRIQAMNLSQNDQRDLVIAQAEIHLGNPYLWGGRSLHDEKNIDVVTGVDCSGLVNWSYRQTGWYIPRDAHEQFMKSRRLKGTDLKRGDLIFLAKPKKPEKIVHVMIYAGEDEIIEAPQTGEEVRRISSEERFGKPLTKIASGEQVKDRIVYFGSFFGEEL